MKTLTEHLTQYAAYHRDRRNIATHFVGIPMIVFGVATLLARPAFDVAGWALSPLVAVTFLTVLFYFLLDLRFGLAMTVFMGSALVTGTWLAAHSTTVWLSAGLALFVLGWVIQFIGHWYEGKKPAFVDDLVGFLIGPLFIVAEAAFAMGMRTNVRDAIEAKVGPTIIRKMGRTAAA
jgi:uncharacterized membrane protein YGL010W